MVFYRKCAIWKAKDIYYWWEEDANKKVSAEMLESSEFISNGKLYRRKNWMCRRIHTSVMIREVEGKKDE